MSLDHNPFIDREKTKKLSKDRKRVAEAIFKDQKKLVGIACRKLNEKGVRAMTGDDLFMKSLERVIKTRKLTYKTDKQACSLAKMKMDSVILDHQRKQCTLKRGFEYVILELKHHHADQLPSQVSEEDGCRMLVEDLLVHLGERFPNVFEEAVTKESSQMDEKDAQYFLNRYYSGDKTASQSLYGILQKDLAAWLNPLFKVDKVMELEGARSLLREVFDHTLNQRLFTLQSLKQQLRNAAYGRFRTNYEQVAHGEEDEVNPALAPVAKAHPLSDALLRKQIINQLLPKYEKILCAFMAKAMGIPAVSFCRHLGVDNGKASKMVQEGSQLLSRVIGEMLKPPSS